MPDLGLKLAPMKHIYLSSNLGFQQKAKKPVLGWALLKSPSLFWGTSLSLLWCVTWALLSKWASPIKSCIFLIQTFRLLKPLAHWSVVGVVWMNITSNFGLIFSRNSLICVKIRAHLIHSNLKIIQIKILTRSPNFIWCPSNCSDSLAHFHL